MKVLVNYSDGSQKVELDDGRIVVKQAIDYNKNEEPPEKIEEQRFQYDADFLIFKEKTLLYQALAQYFNELGDGDAARKMEEYQKAKETFYYDRTVNLHGGNVEPGGYLKNINNIFREDNREYQPPHLPIYNRCSFYSYRVSGITPWNVNIRLYVCIDDDGDLKPYLTVFFFPEYDNRNPQGLFNPEPQALSEWLRKITNSYIKNLSDNS